jgi:hypothetical protein
MVRFHLYKCGASNNNKVQLEWLLIGAIPTAPLTNKNLEKMIESRIIRIENGYEIIGYFLNKVLIKTSRMKLRGWK